MLYKIQIKKTRKNKSFLSKKKKKKSLHAELLLQYALRFLNFKIIYLNEFYLKLRYIATKNL